MVRDHQPITVDDPRGLFDRGEEESVPEGFFLTSRNNRFIRNGVETRQGSTLLHIIGSVRRTSIYKRMGEAQRLLILDATGNLYDSTNLAAPILSIPAMTDFSSETIFNRAYITPHNGITGLPGEKVYVYNGSGVAAPAAGAGPSGFALALSDSALSGKVEAGVHLVGVCYETISGYLTPPGGFMFINNIGGRKLNVGNLPIGPTGVVARVLVSTPIINNFNGDFIHQEYRFIPDGRINDNTTVTLNDTIDYYDADLTDDATYLLDQLTEIPAGVGILLYKGMMVVWGEDVNSSVARVSAVGEPESISAVEGFATINPGDAGNGLKNCWEFNGLLMCQKSQRTYYTQAIDGAEAAFWKVEGPMDSSVGTEPHGVAKILDYGKMVENIVITAHHTGLRVFNGTFVLTPLTYNIEDIWFRINTKYFHTVEVVLNPLDTEIFVAVPLDGATSPNCVIYGDYSEGLTAEKIKWDIWTFPVAPTTIVADYDTTVNKAVFKFGSIAGNIYQMNESVIDDSGSNILGWVEYSLLPMSGSDGVNHFTGFRARIKGSGQVTVTAKGLDDVDRATFDLLRSQSVNLNLSATPGKPIFQGMQLTSERCSVRLEVGNTPGSRYQINRFSLFSTPAWESR